MEGSYEIFMGGQVVGVAQVRREGLYYHFCCRCKLSGEILYRLTVTVGEREENLGIPVPDREEFCLHTRIPAKRFGKGKPIFRILPKHEPMEGRFVPLNPEEPFAYISRLKNAYLDVRNNQTGIVIRYSAPDRPDSDRNP